MDKTQEKISIITCTYNRANTLPTVYKSLCNQTYKNFEWIVVNDGSDDNTEELVKSWINENKLDILYLYEENNGKHIATNLAISKANGYFEINLDSDDFLIDNALEIFIDAWNSIPKKEWKDYYAVKARCFDPKTNKPIGHPKVSGRWEGHLLDAKYKYGFNFEMSAMSRIEVTRQYPNPDIRGGKKNGGLRFYPEGIAQDLASRKYKTLYIPDTVRGYVTDDSSSLMGRNHKYDRSRENYYLWTHIVNDNLDYFFYDIKSFLKAFTGVSMDAKFLKMSYKNMMKTVKGPMRKTLVTLFIPLGHIAYLIKK